MTPARSAPGGTVRITDTRALTAGKPLQTPLAPSTILDEHQAEVELQAN
jgi:hypothetical protein